ncbi:hypothetical protein IE81DRAFT_195178 [Ceraceosorus guamensis]|uniref:Uncharacterized protein n=1 Tax=Ceraceosorus guamensis TaxID=1522189 RepID=A0A316VUU5_9BASI|nr:hypothetical protein IE81DRAFT_195178 [Ceraceosorus guamensis]PWN41034.1 hypothetical protein IE81DRAFT_195178 [Ceraceosorus guamensis]
MKRPQTFFRGSTRASFITNTGPLLIVFAGVRVDGESSFTFGTKYIGKEGDEGGAGARSAENRKKSTSEWVRWRLCGDVRGT